MLQLQMFPKGTRIDRSIRGPVLCLHSISRSDLTKVPWKWVLWSPYGCLPGVPLWGAFLGCLSGAPILGNQSLPSKLHRREQLAKGCTMMRIESLQRHGGSAWRNCWSKDLPARRDLHFKKLSEIHNNHSNESPAFMLKMVLVKHITDHWDISKL